MNVHGQGQRVHYPIVLKPTVRYSPRTYVRNAGPLITIHGLGKRPEKRYLCLFTCATSRTVHLEMAYKLNTDGFLNAFHRMASCRGTPQEIISDNFSILVDAARELKELQDDMNRDSIECKTTTAGVKWTFNPPLVPHFRGLHESKKATYGILNSASVTDEELHTAFVTAEGLINSRPLTSPSSDVHDTTVLTPNHFIFGHAGGAIVPATVDTTPFPLTRRWRYVQDLVQQHSGRDG